MRYIRNIPAEQTWLLPYSLDELVEENNPVRVIRACVDSLPMEGLGFARAVPAQTGRPAYDPCDLLKGYESRQDIEKCLHAGVLSWCYEGTSISVQLQKRSVMSCFIPHEDGRVTCPMGRELFKRRVRRHGTIYGSREACRTCSNRCTDSKNPKTVSIGHNTNIVAVNMYGDPDYPLAQLPDGFKPHNAIGRPQKPARVRLILRRNPDDMQRRKQLVEHPFGTIKWYDGAHYFLCRGKEKVSAEIVLSFLTYNLHRAINILGVGVLVAHFTKRKQENRG